MTRRPRRPRRCGLVGILRRSPPVSNAAQTRQPVLHRRRTYRARHLLGDLRGDEQSDARRAMPDVAGIQAACTPTPIRRLRAPPHPSCSSIATSSITAISNCRWTSERPRGSAAMSLQSPCRRRYLLGLIPVSWKGLGWGSRRFFHGEALANSCALFFHASPVSWE